MDGTKMLMTTPGGKYTPSPTLMSTSGMKKTLIPITYAPILLEV
jgi:hypothetical protein